MTLPPITSRDNPRIKAARALRERRGREEQRAYLIEGVTLLLDALAAGQRPLLVLRDDTRLSAVHRATLDAALAPLAEIVQPVGPAAFRAVAETETPQGVAAILPLPPAATLPPLRPRDLILVADRIQDPGNLGAMLRAAEGAGARGVVTTPGAVDLYNPKVVRAAMGAHFRLQTATDAPWPALAAWVGAAGLPLLGADRAADRSYGEVDWRQGGAVVIGNEAGGLSAAARAAVDGLIGIPLAAPVDSLNAAVAAGVILFEAARQRRTFD
jgi:TrmH family RNA methyltransferase